MTSSCCRAKEASTCQEDRELGWTLAVPLAIPLDRPRLLARTRSTDKMTNVVVCVKRNPEFKAARGRRSCRRRLRRG